jgi:hypothetical protein
MIEILHDEQNNIKAVCEYYVVNSNGEFDRNGEFIWINEYEVSSQYRNNGIFKIVKHLAKAVMEKNPQAKFGYFHRIKKYPERGIRLYHKYRWLKLIGGIK